MPLPDRKNLNPWRNSRFQVEHILSKILNGSGRVALSPKVRSPSTPKNSCANRIARIFQISLQTRIIDNTRIKWYTLHYINLNISILMRSNSDRFLSFFFLIHFSQTVEHRRIKDRLIFNSISFHRFQQIRTDRTLQTNVICQKHIVRKIVPFLFLYIPLYDRNLLKKKKKKKVKLRGK